MTSDHAYALLAPAAVLATWTMVVLLILAYRRFGAAAKAGIDIAKLPVGGRGADFEAAVPGAANWPSHNYTHLLEQPTVFYAVVIILHLSGGSSGLTQGLAWAYVVLRILHSLWQIGVNRIPVRFAIFIAASLCLIALCVLAIITTLG